MTVGELNALDREQFVDALGWIFERSPWVAERTWNHRPFQDVPHLHQAMVAVVDAARPDEQLALLRAHPDLGDRVELSDASAAEQRGAGLDRLAATERERLKRLTGEYRAKFGFPFLFAVRARSTPAAIDQVIDALERRLRAGLEDERREAIDQVYRIAGCRLRDHVE